MATTSSTERPAAPVETHEGGFITEKQLLSRLPVSRRTLYNWRQRGIVPSIKIGDKVLFDWETVRQALLRRQTSKAN